jgi:hypothetical protein
MNADDLRQRARQMRELALFVSDERARQDAQLLEMHYQQAANALERATFTRSAWSLGEARLM